MTKTFLSGVQPSGLPHIGNYFGAMKQFVELQESFGSGYVMIADLHALNTIQDKQTMHDNIVNVMLDYFAIGLDPEKVIMFKQSDVAEHFELAWIFDTITTMPYLMRAHSFKDAEAKNKEISVGKFNYPMLMAADILLYGPDLVPVGQDQKQHLEITRDTAEKFNRIFKTETFKLPEPMIMSAVATVPGIDGQKMSKSYGNTIPLFASDEEIRKLVAGIVTDSSGETPMNVYSIHLLFKPKGELDVLYDMNRGKYKILKEALAEDIIAFVTPLREKRKEYEAKLPEIIQLLKKGGIKAKAVASAKMKEVREAIGVAL